MNWAPAPVEQTGAKDSKQSLTRECQVRLSFLRFLNFDLR